MKKVIIISFLVITIFQPLIAQVVTDGLVGYWPLDQGLENEQVNGHTANINGPVLTTDRNGQVNGAYSFDGVDDYIKYGDILDNIFAGPSKKFSLSLWVYFDDNSSSLLLAKHSHCANERELFFCYHDEKFRITWTGNPSVGRPSRAIATTTTFSPNQWHHIVFTYDATTDLNDGIDRIQIYVNGQSQNLEVASTYGTAVGEISDMNSDLAMGVFMSSGIVCSGTIQPLSGSLDEVLLYNRIISPTEVATLHQGSPPVIANNFAPNEFGILYTDAKVGINTPTVQQDFQLAVKGGIISDRVKVIVPTEWPDYVFSKDYELKGLKEVACYIEENHHLPDVPSANEVKEGGNDLGEMDAILLRKVEELTLYLIDLKKENDELRNRIEVLEK